MWGSATEETEKEEDEDRLFLCLVYFCALATSDLHNYNYSDWQMQPCLKLYWNRILYMQFKRWLISYFEDSMKIDESG